MTQRQQRGFTVIEVIIAVTIAGLLLAAALPSAGTWIRNTKIRTAAESISNGLHHARNESVRRNQPVGFYLVSDAAGATQLSDTCALSATSSGWAITSGFDLGLTGASAASADISARLSSSSE